MSDDLAPHFRDCWPNCHAVDTGRVQVEQDVCLQVGRGRLAFLNCGHRSLKLHLKKLKILLIQFYGNCKKRVLTKIIVLLILIVESICFFP